MSLRNLFTYEERQLFYDKQVWMEGEWGLRLAFLPYLGVLPLEKPIRLELLIYNSGPSPAGATYYVSITNPSIQGIQFSGEAPDLPHGYVFDTAHAIPVPLPPGDYTLTLSCHAHSPATPSPETARPSMEQQQRSHPSSLTVVNAPIPQGLPTLSSTLKIRVSLSCPNCDGALLWRPETVGRHPRGWVCHRCGYTLKVGIL